MLLSCPDCSATFRVPDNALGEAGRTVRCSKCRHEWFAEPRDLTPEEEETQQEAAEVPEPQEEEAPSQEETPEDAAVETDDPALEALGENLLAGDEDEAADTSEEKESGGTRAGLGLIVAFILSLLVLAGAGLVTLRESLSTKAGFSEIYSMLGLASSEGLVLQDLTLGALRAGKKTQYAISGAIVNGSEQVRVVPTVRIRLVDTEGETLKEWSFSQDGSMKPGERKTFNAAKLKSWAGELEHVFVVDIGNGLELTLRE